MGSCRVHRPAHHRGRRGPPHGRFIIKTLREEEICDLVVSNTKVEGSDGVELIQYLRKRSPTLPIIYLANKGRSTPEAEAQLPADVPILREPFTVENLRDTVASMLDGGRA